MAQKLLSQITISRFIAGFKLMKWSALTQLAKATPGISPAIEGVLCRKQQHSP